MPQETTPTQGSSDRVRLFGHDHARQALLAQLRAGSLAQAYLLTGPPLVGKRTLARLTAQALLCQACAPAERPCGACRACRLVRNDAHPDCQLFDEPLRIDAVRSLRSQLLLAPVEAQWRVAILSELELATAGALNALLKTLEEPPPHAVLLMTTASPETLLPTVRSRCQIIRLRPLPLPVVAQALVEHWSVPAEKAEQLARLSGGRLGWALGCLADPSALERRSAWLEKLERALSAGVEDRMRLASELAGDEANLPELLRVWMTWWRDVLLVQHGLDKIVVDRDALGRLRALAQQHTVAQVMASLRAHNTALEYLASNANPLLTLEVLLLELPE